MSSIDFSAEQLPLSELFQLDYSDGTIDYFTSHETSIFFDGNKYLSAPITRTEVNRKSELEVQELKITVPRIEPYITPEKLLTGFYEKTVITVRWVHRRTLNYRFVFRGLAGDINYNETTVTLSFKSELNLFNKTIPRRMYTEACDHVMYGELCSLDKNTWRDSCEVRDEQPYWISDRFGWYVTGGSSIAGYYELGFVEFTEGANDGVKRWIKSYQETSFGWFLQPFVELPFDPADNDNFYAYPHCKKDREICEVVFANSLNYGGFQDIPDIQDALL